MANSRAAVRMVAPVITIGATWIASKTLSAGYRGLTGHEPPQAGDRNTPLIRVVVWALVTASAVAVIDVVVARLGADPLEATDVKPEVE